MDATIRHDPPTRRFVADTDAGVAYVHYALPSPGVIDLQRTFVPEAARRRGLGARLVCAALEHARHERLTVIPTCPFVSSVVDRHPEFRDLLYRG